MLLVSLLQMTSFRAAGAGHTWIVPSLLPDRMRESSELNATL